jgi:hypothetical protein
MWRRRGAERNARSRRPLAKIAKAGPDYLDATSTDLKRQAASSVFGSAIGLRDEGGHATPDRGKLRRKISCCDLHGVLIWRAASSILFLLFADFDRFQNGHVATHLDLHGCARFDNPIVAGQT